MALKIRPRRNWKSVCEFPWSVPSSGTKGFSGHFSPEERERPKSLHTNVFEGSTYTHIAYYTAAVLFVCGERERARLWLPPEKL